MYHFDTDIGGDGGAEILGGGHMLKWMGGGSTVYSILYLYVSALFYRPQEEETKY